MSALAESLLVCAGVLWHGPPRQRLVRWIAACRCLRDRARAASVGRFGGMGRTSTRVALIAAVAAIALLACSSVALAIPTVAATVLGAALGWVRRCARADESAARLSSAWQSALARLASALCAGADIPSGLALGAGADGLGEPARLLSAASSMLRLGGDPGPVLAGTTGVVGVGADLASCLALTHRLGVPPAALITRLSDIETARAVVRRESMVALASARATTRLLAALPVLGLGFAVLADPSGIRILFASFNGQCCLLLAAVFEAAGLVWARRIAADDLE